MVTFTNARANFSYPYVAIIDVLNINEKHVNESTNSAKLVFMLLNKYKVVVKKKKINVFSKYSIYIFNPVIDWINVC